MNIFGYGVPLFALLVLICQNFKLLFISRVPVRLPRNILFLYALYVLFFLLAANINGDASLKTMNMNSLIINYMTSALILISIFATIRVGQYLSKIITLLGIICVFGATVTVLQFTGSSAGWGIWYTLNSTTGEAFLNMADAVNGTGQDVNAGAFCPGLTPTQVYNGYFLASLGFAPLYRFLSAEKLTTKLIWGAGTALVIAALFCAQQRAAFFIFLFLMALMCYSKYRLLTIITIVLAVITAGYFIATIPTDDFGRLFEFEDHTREKIYSAGRDFISEHWMWGGRNLFIKETPHGLTAHNILINAICYSGILGTLCILSIYIIMIWQSIKAIWNHLGHRFGIPVVFACALLAYNLISVTHNNSLVTGEPILFIFYALLLRSLSIERDEKTLHNMA